MYSDKTRPNLNIYSKQTETWETFQVLKTSSSLPFPPWQCLHNSALLGFGKTRNGSIKYNERGSFYGISGLAQNSEAHELSETQCFWVKGDHNDFGFGLYGVLNPGFCFEFGIQMNPKDQA